MDIDSGESSAKRIKRDDVLESIHQKLCFTTDQDHLRELCTSWRFSPCSYTLPWVTLYSEDFSTFDEFGKLFDPYSKKVYVIDYSLKDCQVGSFEDVTVMTSKNGWILFCSELKTGFLLFLRNPFTVEEVIMLPELLNFKCRAATFAKNPDSPDCEFLVLCNPHNVKRLYVARFRLSRSEEWSVQCLEEGAGDYSVHCMEGEMYCLGFGGVLKRYKLEDGSWELLTPFLSYQDGCWTWEHGNLVENGGDLLMVCKLQTHTHKWNMYDREWLVFRFDFSEATWVIKQNLENTAFFVSGRVLFSAPLIDVNGEKKEDCLLFELEEDSCGGGSDKSFDCYSLKENKRVESKTYTWITRCYDRMIFIEPPYLWRW